MRELAGATILNAKDLSQIAPITGGKALQRYIYYSILDMPIAGVTELPFFATPQGGTQVVGATSLTMNRERTNIQKAGAIATPNDYILKNIRLFVFPNISESDHCTAASLKDLLLILETGYMKLVFGEREHLLVAPLMSISAGFGLSGALSTNTTVTNLMFNDHPLLFKVEPWVLIPSELNFQLSLNWTTAPNIAAIARIGMWFDGDLIRNVG